MEEELKNLDKILSRKLREEYERHGKKVKELWAKYNKNKERIIKSYAPIV